VREGLVGDGTSRPVVRAGRHASSDAAERMVNDCDCNSTFALRNARAMRQVILRLDGKRDRGPKTGRERPGPRRAISIRGTVSDATAPSWGSRFRPRNEAVASHCPAQWKGKTMLRDPQSFFLPCLPQAVAVLATPVWSCTTSGYPPLVTGNSLTYQKNTGTPSAKATLVGTAIIAGVSAMRTRTARESYGSGANGLEPHQSMDDHPGEAMTETFKPPPVFCGSHAEPGPDHDQRRSDHGGRGLECRLRNPVTARLHTRGIRNAQRSGSTR
jgi:hypothetical protein